MADEDYCAEGYRVKQCYNCGTIYQRSCDKCPNCQSKTYSEGILPYWYADDPNIPEEYQQAS